SIDELISRTGLHRAAVYERFGSKRGLFEATLRRYRERVIAKLVAPLAGPDAARADIDRFFGEIHRAAAAAPATTLRHYVDGVLGFLDGLRPESRGRQRARRA